MKLYYYYDHEADTFYLSQGKPTKNIISQETSDDVILRLDPKTKKIKGFTILNFRKRSKTGTPVSIPIQAQLKYQAA